MVTSLRGLSKRLNMQIKSVQKFVRTSPRKLRLVANIAKQISPIDAVDVLPHTSKRAAEPLVKVIKSALANAKVAGISEERLFFEEIQINEGPRLKRGRAVSRGRWHPYQRKMSHIRIVLGVKEEKKIVAKSTTKEVADKKPKNPKSVKTKKVTKEKVVKAKEIKKGDK